MKVEKNNPQLSLNSHSKSGSKAKKVPKLRFKEFSEEWLEKEFGSVYSFFQTNSFSRSLLNYENGTIKNIHYGDIHTKYKSMFYISDEEVPFLSNDIDITKIKDQSYCMVKDLIIADASEDYKDIGKAIEIIDLEDQKLVAGLHTYIARDLNNLTYLGFSGYLMQSYKIRSQMMKYATGISVLGLSKTSLSKIKINLPTLPEQQKIADCLSTWDDSIENLKSLIENKKLYKKGMMQKLFSQELRFKADDGSNYPAWVEKKLGEMGNITTGSTPSTKNSEYYGGDKLFVSPSDINSSRYIKRTNTTLTELGFKKGRKVSKGSVCFVCIGSTIGKVSQLTQDSLTNQQINCITANSNNSNEFTYSLLEYNADKIKLLAGEQAVPQINKSDFSRLKFLTPCLQEQTKIANFLSALDDEIELLGQELEQLQLQKKGLMQGMFV
ncbi:restriction endonuclease subunit S [Francisella hispaniensis]|uniref:Type I restriction-modification system, specificity subunit S n=1 Tax=Francisella hispaniensis TaxID=622488 RepID=F4BK88_9GAMM|nr:restriction endonuclease subunit S [Francisella hispaniensis]AEB28582.1 Type I restriction-modification system, specificity subunit S [Francisella hispaniensis]